VEVLVGLDLAHGGFGDEVLAGPAAGRQRLPLGLRRRCARANVAGAAALFFTYVTYQFFFCLRLVLVFSPNYSFLFALSFSLISTRARAKRMYGEDWIGCNVRRSSIRLPGRRLARLRARWSRRCSWRRVSRQRGEKARIMEPFFRDAGARARIFFPRLGWGCQLLTLWDLGQCCRRLSRKEISGRVGLAFRVWTRRMHATRVSQARAKASKDGGTYRRGRWSGCLRPLCFGEGS